MSLKSAVTLCLEDPTALVDFKGKQILNFELGPGPCFFRCLTRGILPAPDWLVTSGKPVLSQDFVQLVLEVALPEGGALELTSSDFFVTTRHEESLVVITTALQPKQNFFSLDFYAH